MRATVKYEDYESCEGFLCEEAQLRFFLERLDELIESGKKVTAELRMTDLKEMHIESPNTAGYLLDSLLERNASIIIGSTEPDFRLRVNKIAHWEHFYRHHVTCDDPDESFFKEVEDSLSENDMTIVLVPRTQAKLVIEPLIKMVGSQDKLRIVIK